MYLLRVKRKHHWNDPAKTLADMRHRPDWRGMKVV
jgi:hypothetical protein